MSAAEAHAVAVALAAIDPTHRVTCDVCEGRTTTRTVGIQGTVNTPCPRCRGCGWRPVESDPAAAAHVSVHTDGVGGAVRLDSASGPLEALWIRLDDEHGKRAASVRVTPSQARALGALLTRYADTHKETDE